MVLFARRNKSTDRYVNHQDEEEAGYARLFHFQGTGMNFYYSCRRIITPTCYILLAFKIVSQPDINIMILMFFEYVNVVDRFGTQVNLI
jgi:hypothetical protein